VEIFLEIVRLVLRQFTEDDVDVLVQLDGDPDVMHFKLRVLPEFLLPALCRSRSPLVGAKPWPANKPSDGLEPSTPSLPWRCSTD
jgi:hypothetical protein